jgi:hypothetical protein
VGREQTALQGTERAVGWERLDFKDIERRASEPTLFERFDKRWLVNHRAA